MPPTEPVADSLEQFEDSDSRHYIVRNIKDISREIVRGKNAGRKWEVFVYRVHSVVMGVLGTAGGGGHRRRLVSSRSDRRGLHDRNHLVGFRGRSRSV